MTDKKKTMRELLEQVGKNSTNIQEQDNVPFFQRPMANIRNWLGSNSSSNANTSTSSNPPPQRKGGNPFRTAADQSRREFNANRSASEPSSEPEQPNVVTRVAAVQANLNRNRAAASTNNTTSPPARATTG
jgi:hypothetical protein